MVFYLMFTSYLQFMFVFLQKLVIQYHWTILCCHKFATNLWCHWQYAHPIEWKIKQMAYVFYCKFYKLKHYHRIMVQTICDCGQCFWNVYACELGGIVDEGYFKMSSLYCVSWTYRFCKNPLLILEVWKFDLSFFVMLHIPFE